MDDHDCEEYDGECWGWGWHAPALDASEDAFTPEERAALDRMGTDLNWDDDWAPVPFKEGDPF
jgi:hypothetical protein